MKDQIYDSSTGKIVSKKAAERRYGYRGPRSDPRERNIPQFRDKHHGKGAYRRS